VEKINKIRIFSFLFVILWIPILQECTRLVPETELKGAFMKPTEPNLTLDSLVSFDYQKQYEAYKNFNFGFRPLLVRIRNSINHILFNELSVTDNIEGKDNYIYSRGSIDRTLGITYNGKDKNNATLDKINFLKEGVEHHGGKFITIIAPSKESILPEFLPVLYEGKQKEQTDYLDFIQGYNTRNIACLDMRAYFQKLKPISQYPLFTKTGFHWSMYGASLAQDTLIRYFEKTSGKPLPKYEKLGVETSDTARGADEDFEDPLNLLFKLGENSYVYPKFQIVQSSMKNYRPKVIVIGDSYFWQIKHQKMLAHIVSEDSKFWYYFGTNSFPISDAAGVPLKNIDVVRELNGADYVILIGNLGTMDAFPFGVTEYYYNNCAPPEILSGVNSGVRCVSDLMSRLNTFSKSQTIPLDVLVEQQAMGICRDKVAFTLLGPNGKYACADGGKNNIIIVDRDYGGIWETFSLVKLCNDQVGIYSYANKFFSAELSGNTSIAAVRNKIEAWETFTMINLPDGTTAFKAFNGKYLSMDENTKQLFARGNSIGVNEKFKMEIKK
jgi:hypothetical protein